MHYFRAGGTSQINYQRLAVSINEQRCKSQQYYGENPTTILVSKCLWSCLPTCKSQDSVGEIRIILRAVPGRKPLFSDGLPPQIPVLNFPTEFWDLHPVLLLKEFDEDRGEHVGVNHMGLTCERLAAGVWQDVGQRISAVVDPGVARTAIYHQHWHGHIDPATRWERFALHDIADKRRVVGNGMCHAGYSRPHCLILLHAADVFRRNAHGLRQKVFDRFVTLPL